eukprot:TRINITY_DN2815_c0_g1_i2.p1 TRINITY_DN2815_c0_g1~~TRINITY_DN2815_c0_g1_i2.p1  ORF type:complete len:455 (-),score=130.84 TRINITY_DN2815_c0_g1_i2:166-1530(-)
MDLAALRRDMHRKYMEKADAPPATPSPPPPAQNEVVPAVPLPLHHNDNDDDMDNNNNDDDDNQPRHPAPKRYAYDPEEQRRIEEEDYFREQGDAMMGDAHRADTDHEDEGGDEGEGDGRGEDDDEGMRGRNRDGDGDDEEYNDDDDGRRRDMEDEDNEGEEDDEVEDDEEELRGQFPPAFIGGGRGRGRGGMFGRGGGGGMFGRGGRGVWHGGYGGGGGMVEGEGHRLGSNAEDDGGLFGPRPVPGGGAPGARANEPTDVRDARLRRLAHPQTATSSSSSPSSLSSRSSKQASSGLYHAKSLSTILLDFIGSRLELFWHRMSSLPSDVITLIIDDLVKKKKMDKKIMRHFAGLRIFKLNFDNYNQVTNEFLEAVSLNRMLTSLSLGGCYYTDAGVGHLQGLTSLSSLNLKGGNVTDTGIRYLKGLASLTDLNLRYDFHLCYLLTLSLLFTISYG